MKLNEALQTDRELWEYLLVVHPTEEVNAEILKEKRLFEEKYAHEKDTRFYPHITVAAILAKEELEETFTRWIQNICNLQKSFMVTLNNYSAFPSSGLYLRVQDATPFKQLANAMKILDGFMTSNGCPALHLVSKPYLTFAKGLSQYSFDSAINEYSQKTFHAAFRVDRLILLKRNHFTRCQLINTFILPPFNLI